MEFTCSRVLINLCRNALFINLFIHLSHTHCQKLELIIINFKLDRYETRPLLSVVEWSGVVFCDGFSPDVDGAQLFVLRLDHFARHNIISLLSLARTNPPCATDTGWNCYPLGHLSRSWTHTWIGNCARQETISMHLSTNPGNIGSSQFNGWLIHTRTRNQDVSPGNGRNNIKLLFVTRVYLTVFCVFILIKGRAEYPKHVRPR